MHVPTLSFPTATQLTQLRQLTYNVWVGLLLVALGISPWFFWSQSAVVYEVPRVFFWLATVELLLVICCIWAVLSVIQNRAFFRVRTSMIVCLMVWLAVGFASSVHNHVLIKSLLGNYFRIDGLLTQIHLYLLAVMLSIIWPSQSKYYTWFVSTILISSFGISIWALASVWRSLLEFVATGTIPLAPSISFGNPNLLAGFLLMCLPVWWFAWKTVAPGNSTVRRALVAGIGITCLALGATQAMSALVGGVMAVCLLVILSRPSYLKIGLAIIITILSIAGFWGIAFYQGTQHFETESRYRIAHKLGLAIADKPWLGWGWSQVSTAFTAHPWPLPILHDVYVDKAHSHLLEALTTTGVIGLAAYSFLLALHLKIISQKRMTAATTAEKQWLTMWLVIVLLFVYHSQTNVISIQEEIFFWLSIGLISLPKPSTPRILD